MTPTCGNCKYWQEKYDMGYGSCANKKVTDTSTAMAAQDTITHYDESAPFLSFGKNFGCVHFASKTDTPPFSLWVKKHA
jgi:hypothetical protein